VLGKETVAADVKAITKEIASRRVPGALIVPEGILDASS
jgi:hypothetical protein